MFSLIERTARQDQFLGYFRPVFLVLVLVLALPGARAQSACSFDGATPTGSRECNCFESQSPQGWIVDCSGRSFTDVPTAIPTDTVYLSLSGNSITTLSDTDFQGLSNLQTLHIKNNDLRSDFIAVGAFSHLGSLTTLDLSDNRLLLSVEMVTRLLPLTSLTSLTLTNNNINTIHESVIGMLDQLDSLDLTGNQLECDCNLGWFRNWLYNTGRDIPGATCYSPPEYQRVEIATAGFCPSAVCYACSGGSDAECNNQPSSIQICSQSQGACRSEIRVNNGVYRVEKSCQQLQSCLNQVSNNDRDCNMDVVNSVCRTCCQGDVCNAASSGVLIGYTLPGFPMEPDLVLETTTLAATTTRPTTSSATTTQSTTVNTNLLPNRNRQRRHRRDNDSQRDRGFSWIKFPFNVPIGQSTSIFTVTSTSTTSTPSSTPTSPSASTSTSRDPSPTSMPTERTRPATSSTTSTKHASEATRTATMSTREPPTTTEVVVVLTCPEETLVDDHGEIIWRETRAGETAQAQCPFGSVDPKDNATRRCGLNQTTSIAVWEDPATSSCTTTTEILTDLSATPITSDNAESVSMSLMMVTESPKGLSAVDIELAVDVLENLAHSSDEYSNTSIAVATNMLDSVSNLAAARTETLVAGQQDAQTATRVLHAIDEFALNVKIVGDSLKAVSEGVDIVVLKVDNAITADGVAFQGVTGQDGDGQIAVSVNGSEQASIPEAQASVQLPPAAFASQTGQAVERLQFVLYKDVTFFQVITESADDMNSTPTTVSTSTADGVLATNALNSLVISASVGNMSITGLEEPVITSFLHQRSESAGNPSCVFWDFKAAGGQGSWSKEGCRVFLDAEGSTQCACSHLTNFALLMDIYDSTRDFNNDHLRALSLITYVGCGLSILGLTMTFISYLMIRQLRTDRRNRVLLNLVVALFLMNVFFLVDVAVVELSGDPGVWACKLLGALLHYGLLTAVAWMALEAWHMYLALVKVFDSYTSHLMKKMAAIGWGVPIIVVGVTIGVDLDHYGFYSDFCWLRVGSISFYASLIAPAVAMLLFNSVIFCLVTRQLCSLRRRTVVASSEQFDVSAQLRASLSITVLLGLTWGLAIFTIGEASLVFSYLFAIFNSLQGFGIFVLHCLLKEEFRLGWKKILCPQCLTLEELAKTSSGQQFSSSNKQAQFQKRMTLDSQVMNGNHHVDAMAFNNGHDHGVPNFDPFATSRPNSYQDSSI